METRLFEIRGSFAKSKGCPIFFAGVKILETDKAVYLYGHGTAEAARMGVCVKCGRKLTHPVSVELGIGPECGGHWHNWETIGGYTEENIARLKNAMQDIKVDGWFPKACIEEEYDSKESVQVPADHPMIRTPGATTERKKEPRTAKSVVYSESKNRAIKITFPFDYGDLEKVKSLPGRRFHNTGGAKYWTCPLSIDAVEALQGWGFEMDPRLLEFVSSNKIDISTLPKAVDIPSLQMPLFGYQTEGVAFLNAKNGRALLGDEMGLGKTAQALAWLEANPKARPAIVVVPSSLKLNWEKEARMWMSNPRTQILSGKKADQPINGEILIINYDIIRAWVPKLKTIKPKALILDEAHYIKNRTAKRTTAIKALAKGLPHVIAMTGTPIVNRPGELFNAISIIEPSLFPSWFKYAQRYCDAKHNGFGWDYNGASNTDELHKKLTGTIMLRRKKCDVMKELPAKIRSIIPMELSNKKEYRQAEADFIAWVRDTKGRKAAEKASNAEALARIEGLKQLAVAGKLSQAIDWVTDYLEGNGKLVLFATHRSVIDTVMSALAQFNPVKVDGSVTGQGRQDAVERFQGDDTCRLFVGNIKAAGVGLTLTAASSVAFLELGWTPGDQDQAEDRIHRIGQTAESVNAYYLLAAGTIEEEIAQLIDRKRKVLDTVLDGNETKAENLLAELLKTYGG